MTNDDRLYHACILTSNRGQAKPCLSDNYIYNVLYDLLSTSVTAKSISSACAWF